jgi:hypothetical protein
VFGVGSWIKLPRVLLQFFQAIKFFKNFDDFFKWEASCRFAPAICEQMFNKN